MKLFKSIAVALAALLSVPVATHAAAPTSVTHPDWSRNAVIYEVNTRQYTPQGTFNAFAKELPRLKNLGVDILWFMPIHPISQKNRKGTLGSYYAVADYKGVNPEFGTTADFKALVDKAHALGMKVIIDWVPNHTGCDNPWVEQHPEYYARNDKGEMFGPYDWTDVYKLDYSNPATREAMTDALAYWLRDIGIDGFRCDVAFEVPVDYWNEARNALQLINPDLFMLAEASFAPLNEKAFDMSYNWPMKDLFSQIAATKGEYSFIAEGATEPKTFDPAVAADIPALVKAQNEEFPAGTILMNMITNHDLNSWEGTEFQRLGKFVEPFAVLTYTLPGMPLMYTGQEVGLNRAFEFFEKDTAPDFTPNNFTAFYKQLNALKHNRTELAAGPTGAPMTVFATENPDLLVFERRIGDRATIVGVNLSEKPAEVKFTGDAPVLSKNLLNPMTGAAVQALPTTLLPGGYFLFTEN